MDVIIQPDFLQKPSNLMELPLILPFLVENIRRDIETCRDIQLPVRKTFQTRR